MAYPSEADFLVDRRLLRRKLTFWRVALFALLAALLIGLGVHYEIRRAHV